MASGWPLPSNSNAQESGYSLDYIPFYGRAGSTAALLWVVDTWPSRANIFGEFVNLGHKNWGSDWGKLGTHADWEGQGCLSGKIMVGATEQQIQMQRCCSVEGRAWARQVAKRPCSLRNTPTCVRLGAEMYQVHMCIYVPAPGSSSLQLEAGCHWGREGGHCAMGLFCSQVSSLSLGFPEAVPETRP